MTTPILKIKVTQRPVLKGKMDVRFPASVVGGAGIEVTRANGVYTFDLDQVEVASLFSGTFQAADPDLIAIAGLVDPNADRILFWDDSAGTYAYLTLGTNLSITGTTLDAAGGGSGSSAMTRIFKFQNFA